MPPPPPPPPPPPSSPSLPQDKEPTGFFHLPLEIRREIYSYFVPHKPFNVYNFYNELEDNEEWAFLNNPHDQIVINSLLLVCKQIYHEASELLYAAADFEVSLNGDPCYYLEAIFNKDFRGRIRRMTLEASSPFNYYSSGLPYENLWSPLLGQLTHLTIIAQQPLHPQKYFRAPSLDVDIARWVEWIGPILRFIGKELRPGCIVTVDDDNRPETRALMEQSFSTGFRQLQTETGDFHFERGKYSGGNEFSSWLGPNI